MKKVFILIQIVFLFFANSVFAQTTGSYPTCKTGISSLSGTISSSLYQNNIYSVNNDLYINNTVTFENVELIMGANVTIHINTYGSLILKSCHLYGCSSMWNGIVLSTKSALRLTTSSTSVNLPCFIEDAKIAVKIDSVETNDQPTTYMLNVDNTIFNRNYIGIQFSNHINTYSWYSQYFSVQNTVFTCRDIPFTSGDISSYPTSAWTSINNLIHDPWNNFSYPRFRQANRSDYFYDYDSIGANVTSYHTASFLKSPYDNKKSSIGIYIFNPNVDLNIGKIGSDSVNNTVVFDNQDYGIYNQTTVSLRNNLNITNSCFQDPYIITNATGASTHGYGIYMEGGNALNVLPASDGRGNAFYNLNYGIYSVNNSTTNVQKALFASQQTPQGNSAILGSKGVYISKTISNSVASIDTISNSCIYNIKFPIQINNSNTSLSANYTITNDTIDLKSSAPAFGTLTGVMNNAITAFGQAGSTSTSIKNLNITSNSIKNVRNGVILYNWNKTNLVVNDNIIALLQNNASNNYGIEMISCKPAGTNKSGSFGNQIKNNIISCNNNGYTYKAIGIDVQMSYGTEIRCNYLNDLYKGVRFYGSCPSAKLAGNSFSNNASGSIQYGLVLESNGAIPDQGIYKSNSGGEPSENYWSESWNSPAFKTYTLLNSNLNKSKIYYGNGESSSFIPSDSWLVPNFDLSIPYDTARVKPTSYPSVLKCASYNVCTPCTGVWRMLENRIPNDWSDDVTFAENLALADADNDTIPNNANAIYVAKQSLYNDLMNYDGTVADSILYYSSTLLNFIAQNQGNAFEKIFDIQNTITSGDLGGAAGLLSNLSPSNQVETNFVQYFGFLLQYLNGTEFTQQNIDDLYNLSMLCPTLNGECIYGARSLYNALLPDNEVVYDDVCGSDENQFGRSSRSNQEAGFTRKNAAPFKINIYPNPTAMDGYIHIAFENSHGYNKVELYNMLGHKLQEEMVLPGISRINLTLNYPSGIYVVSVTNIKTGIQQMHKIFLK